MKNDNIILMRARNPEIKGSWTRDKEKRCWRSCRTGNPWKPHRQDASSHSITSMDVPMITSSIQLPLAGTASPMLRWGVHHRHRASTTHGRLISMRFSRHKSVLI